MLNNSNELIAEDLTQSPETGLEKVQSPETGVEKVQSPATGVEMVQPKPLGPSSPIESLLKSINEVPKLSDQEKKELVENIKNVEKMPIDSKPEDSKIQISKLLISLKKFYYKLGDDLVFQVLTIINEPAKLYLSTEKEFKALNTFDKTHFKKSLTNSLQAKQYEQTFQIIHFVNSHRGEQESRNKDNKDFLYIYVRDLLVDAKNKKTEDPKASSSKKPEDSKVSPTPLEGIEKERAAIVVNGIIQSCALLKNYKHFENIDGLLLEKLEQKQLDIDDIRFNIVSDVDKDNKPKIVFMGLSIELKQQQNDLESSMKRSGIKKSTTLKVNTESDQVPLYILHVKLKEKDAYNDPPKVAKSVSLLCYGKDDKGTSLLENLLAFYIKNTAFSVDHYLLIEALIAQDFKGLKKLFDLKPNALLSEKLKETSADQKENKRSFLTSIFIAYVVLNHNTKSSMNYRKLNDKFAADYSHSVNASTLDEEDWRTDVIKQVFRVSGSESKIAITVFALYEQKFEEKADYIKLESLLEVFYNHAKNGETHFENTSLDEKFYEIHHKSKLEKLYEKIKKEKQIETKKSENFYVIDQEQEEDQEKEAKVKRELETKESTQQEKYLKFSEFVKLVAIEEERTHKGYAETVHNANSRVDTEINEENGQFLKSSTSTQLSINPYIREFTKRDPGLLHGVRSLIAKPNIRKDTTCTIGFRLSQILYLIYTYGNLLYTIFALNSISGLTSYNFPQLNYSKISAISAITSVVILFYTTLNILVGYFLNHTSNWWRFLIYVEQTKEHRGIKTFVAFTALFILVCQIYAWSVCQTVVNLTCGTIFVNSSGSTSSAVYKSVWNNINKMTCDNDPNSQAFLLKFPTNKIPASFDAQDILLISNMCTNIRESCVSYCDAANGYLSFFFAIITALLSGYATITYNGAIFTEYPTINRIFKKIKLPYWNLTTVVNFIFRSKIKTHFPIYQIWTSSADIFGSLPQMAQLYETYERDALDVHDHLPWGWSKNCSDYDYICYKAAFENMFLNKSDAPQPSIKGITDTPLPKKASTDTTDSIKASALTTMPKEYRNDEWFYFYGLEEDQVQYLLMRLMKITNIYPYDFDVFANIQITVYNGKYALKVHFQRSETAKVQSFLTFLPDGTYFLLNQLTHPSRLPYPVKVIAAIFALPWLCLFETIFKALIHFLKFLAFFIFYPLYFTLFSFYLIIRYCWRVIQWTLSPIDNFDSDDKWYKKGGIVFLLIFATIMTTSLAFSGMLIVYTAVLVGVLVFLLLGTMLCCFVLFFDIIRGTLHSTFLLFTICLLPEIQPVKVHNWYFEQAKFLQLPDDTKEKRQRKLLDFPAYVNKFDPQYRLKQVFSKLELDNMYDKAHEVGVEDPFYIPVEEISKAMNQKVQELIDFVKEKIDEDEYYNY